MKSYIKPIVFYSKDAICAYCAITYQAKRSPKVRSPFGDPLQRLVRWKAVAHRLGVRARNCYWLTAAIPSGEYRSPST